MARAVFISYASEDRTTADRVCGALENTGLTCWMAPRDIPPGTEYPAAIVDGIRNASVLVLLLSDAAVASPHILSEVGHAFNGRKRIVPFRLSAVAMPPDLEYFLSMTQWLDAEDGPTEENLKRLITAVRAAVAGQKAAVETLQRRSKRRMVVAGIAGLLAVSAGAAAYWLRPVAAPVSPPKTAPELGTPKSEPAKEPAVAIPAAPKSPAPWVNPADGETYVWVPPGNFVMGCSQGDSQCEDNEKPSHPVNIAQGFWMARTEVTLRTWRPYAAKHGLRALEGSDKLPARAVIWADAKQYCAAIGGRLPTEAEWEYAARGGVAQSVYGPLPDIAWYAENSGDGTKPVQLKAPNGFGLYDMLGNVAEWALDRYYNKYYLDSPATGPKVEQPLAGNASGVVRGGFYGREQDDIRLSRRVGVPPDVPMGTIGFRCIAQHPAP
jgi:formylglycine-generating enzyme required for sulfatase activity